MMGFGALYIRQRVNAIDWCQIRGWFLVVCGGGGDGDGGVL